MRGFFLLELVVSMAFVAVISAAGVFHFAKWRDAHCLREQTALAENLLTALTSEAQSLNTTIQLLLNETTKKLVVQPKDGRKRTHNVPQCIEGITSTARRDENDVPTILFYPSGVASPARVRFTNNTGDCDIILSLRGAVRSLCS